MDGLMTPRSSSEADSSWCGHPFRCSCFPSRHVHILGSVQNIKIARDAIVSLILGSPPGEFRSGVRDALSACSDDRVDGNFYRQGLCSFEERRCQAETEVLERDLCPRGSSCPVIPYRGSIAPHARSTADILSRFTYDIHLFFPDCSPAL